MTEDPRIIRQRLRLERIEWHRPLHVAELADVVRPVLDRRPPQERIAHRLHRLLVLDDSLSLMGVPRHFTMYVASDDRSPGLLQLQKDDVVRAAPLEQRDVASQPDAADTDDFVSDVDQRVAAHNALPMRRERAQIVVDGSRNPLERCPWNASDQRRLVDDLTGAAQLSGESRQRAVRTPPGSVPRATARTSAS